MQTASNFADQQPSLYGSDHRGALGDRGRLSLSLSLSSALARMQIRQESLDMCVSETFALFEQSNPAEALQLDYMDCSVYAAQAMFASMVVAMGALEESVVDEGALIQGKHLEAALDMCVSNEFLACGFFESTDSLAAWSYKLAVFDESWAFNAELLSCSDVLCASVKRVCLDWERRIQLGSQGSLQS